MIDIAFTISFKNFIEVRIKKTIDFKKTHFVD